MPALGGFPAPLLYPLLKGKKYDFSFLSWVHIQTSSVSTAKFTINLPKRNNSSFGSRFVLYCLMACSTFCLVSSFFNSKEIIGIPLMKSTRSKDFLFCDEK